jgi:uncharacterized membrane protein
MYWSAQLGDPYILLWLFFVFSFCGVVLEMLHCWAIEVRGVIESRVGLLYLPLNPLYGVGALAASVALVPFLDNPLIVALLGMAVCTVIEFVVSFAMEKTVRAVFWDYSARPLNLFGRICLQHSVYWALLSLLLVYVLNPPVVFVVEAIPRSVGLPVLVVLCAATAMSTVLTLAAFARLDRKVAALRAAEDGLDAELPDTRIGNLIDRLVPDEVLINTFPRMSRVVEYQGLTCRRRRTWRLDLHLGRPSPLIRDARERAALYTKARD